MTKCSPKKNRFLSFCAIPQPRNNYICVCIVVVDWYDCAIQHTTLWWVAELSSQINKYLTDSLFLSFLFLQIELTTLAGRIKIMLIDELNSSCCCCLGNGLSFYFELKLPNVTNQWPFAMRPHDKLKRFFRFSNICILYIHL